MGRIDMLREAAILVYGDKDFLVDDWYGAYIEDEDRWWNPINDKTATEELALTTGVNTSGRISTEEDRVSIVREAVKTKH